MIAVIKYNAGNVFSVLCALRRVGAECVLTDDRDTILTADKVIFPGVGEASTAMSYLREKGLDEVIKSVKSPLLGICIGLQVMCRHSEEGNVDGIGIFDTVVRRFDNSACREMKIPHMGWNTIQRLGDCWLSESFEDAYVYYVHSYDAELCSHTVATTDYITKFSASLQRDNFYATQFHPEKSGSVGEAVLKQFLAL